MAVGRTIAMKVFGAGASPLTHDYRRSIQAVARLDFVDAIVIEMKGLDEIQKNVEAVV